MDDLLQNVKDDIDHTFDALIQQVVVETAKAQKRVVAQEIIDRTMEAIKVRFENSVVWNERC